MLNYKKYILASLAGLILYSVFCFFTKRAVDPILGGLIAGAIAIFLSYRDLREVKSEFREMKDNITDYAQDGNFDKFYNNQNKLLVKTNRPSIKNIIRLNIASGLIKENRVEEGKKYLYSVNLKEFDSKNLENAILNKLFLMYRVNDDDRADELFDNYYNKDVKNKSVLFMVINTLRYNKSSKDGIRELSNINMRKDAEPFRPYIEIAKTIILENIK